MIIDIQDIEKFCEILRKGNKTIALTNGTFDLIHAGHVRYLNEASKLADYLILGLNSDQSVKQYKSDKRPIVSQKERAEVIDSLKAVDYVVIFDETTADKLISKVKPDIYVKGGDYTEESLPPCWAARLTTGISAPRPRRSRCGFALRACTSSTPACGTAH